MVAQGRREWQDDHDHDHDQGREGQSLLPEDPLGQRFLEHFHHPWGFIYAPVPEKGERPAWVTENGYPLQPRNLWRQYLSATVLLGLSFGKWTDYLMLDIDFGSQYHPRNNPQRFQELLGVLEGIGLCRPVPVRSSDSEGIHLYYFFNKPLHSFSLACAVSLALKEAGLTVKSGQLELFPNPKPYGLDKPTNFKAHRLPLQTGSYLLDDDLQPCSNDLAEFLDAAEWSATGQDEEILEQALTAARKQKMFWSSSGKRNAAQVWRQDLEERISEGFTDAHQTNYLLKDIGCYGIVFQKLQGQELVEYIAATAIALPGYQQYCHHQHEIKKRAAEWAQCCEGFYTPYPSYPNRLRSYKEQFGLRQEAANNIVGFSPNQQRHEQTLARITAVVTALKEQGTFPSTKSARAKAIIATSKELYGVGVSQTTLHKSNYLELWHPDHEKERVNADEIQVCAPQQPEKYPPLSDPWLQDSNPEIPVPQAVQEISDPIYTLPPYMKVFCLPQAKEIEIENFNFLQFSTDKHNQYPLSGGAALTNHKPALSMDETPEETPDAAVVSDDSRKSESSIDSENDSSGAAVLPPYSPASTQVSTQFSTLPSVPDNDLHGDAPAALEDIFSALLRPLVVSEPIAEPLPERCETDAAASAFTPEQHRQAASLRVQAFIKAKERVKRYCLAQEIKLMLWQRQEVELLAKRILIAQSGSPILWLEAREWFTVNWDGLKRRGLGWIGINLFPDLFG